VCPAGHTYFEVKVLYWPDSGSNPAFYPIKAFKRSLAYQIGEQFFFVQIILKFFYKPLHYYFQLLL